MRVIYDEKTIEFDEPPRIGNRDDALTLLDTLLEPGVTVVRPDLAMEALRDAIERFII